jgi:uncharacterized membrane protein YfcA
MDLQLFSFNLAPWQWAAVIFCAICIGISKTAISGITSINVPIMALIFGAKESTGIILPMLCFADLFAVIYYRRNAEWKYIRKLVPWAVAGFGLALLVDRFIPAKAFRILIAVCIFSGLAVMIWRDLRKDAEIPSAWWFAAFFGIMGGFSTMIGNAAGPIMSVFLLSMHLPKKSFVGTGAWFFLIINYLKIPVQHFAWHNITREGILLNVCLIPAILAGIFLGIFLIKKISEKQFRIVIYVLTVVTAFLLFL